MRFEILEKVERWLVGSAGESDQALQARQAEDDDVAAREPEELDPVYWLPPFPPC
ncbi:hypothetical protein GRF61_21795 [Azoarcus sp. TTM-91]|uniref:hypothetical protein n=1 Tax=Azoarcus sp. TTM-91 TaxID=2691581 RepID=UPI00145D956F|nr:hypothetical protein [Azoarcus sp. TTM-91]NMG37094.1 hypothetical protein [Azoarcus sp. TTM-91]